MARPLILIGLLLFALAGCSSKFRTYDGPEVTRLLLFKGDRQLVLMHRNAVLQKYHVGLGFAPTGDKLYEGDGRTPEGHYTIDKRNPESRYHLSIGISYPNDYDLAEAAAVGRRAGGDIFIHGRGPTYRRGAPRDWTWGCIAVTDREMETIYAMVSDGTPISIYP